MASLHAFQVSTRLAATWLALLTALPAVAQEVFRCTSADGKVTYQQAPCPKTSDERKVDATPANTDFDLSKREQLLKQGEEAGRRLEARAAEERAEQQRRAEAAAQRERETQAREDAREYQDFIYARPPGWRPLPYPPQPTLPPQRPIAKPVPR
jgi:septal ring factor EnvC (AmiA/AmiB activator)